MPRRFSIGLNAALIVALCPAWALADTFHVPGDFATIQECIDAAQSGIDECIVAPGTYNETINFFGKAITLRSSDGPAVTIIDATGAVGCIVDNCSVVKCVSAEGPETVLDGFTITGGMGFVLDVSSTLGGGMFNLNSSPTVANCMFIGNTAIDGGGMYNRDNSHPTVVNCVFTGNEATGGAPPTASVGGGMANINNCSPTVTSCIFSGNTSADSAGGMYSFNSRPTLRNCLFIGNTAGMNGGGMHVQAGSSLTLTNCAFAGNSAGNSGGGLYTLGNSTATIKNCIFGGNSDAGGTDASAQIHDDVGSASEVNYSNVEGGWIGAGGIGNINSDPAFVRDPDPGPDGNWDGVDDDYGDLHLQPGSPCIDAGNNDAVLSDTDLDGKPRIIDGDDDCDPIVDMGAYEIGQAEDCNSNWTADVCDIDPLDPDGDGLISDDCNTNGIPDECELLGNDCNNNGIPDECDPDCQPNGVPDDCDLACQPTTGLIAWWRMDTRLGDQDGDIIPDSSGHGHDLTINGAPTFQDGIVVFNDDGTLETPDSDELDLLGDWSVSYWAREDSNDHSPDSNPSNWWMSKAVAYADSDGGWTLNSSDNYSVTAAIYGSPNCDHRTPNRLALGAWYRLTTTFDSATTTVRIYFDNTLEYEASGTCSHGMGNNGTPVLLGGDILSDLTRRPKCKGAMADVRIYDRALSDAEVGQLAQCDAFGGSVRGDCNENDIPDECDIAEGNSQDCNANGIPDECELLNNDCNANGIPDECEEDCQPNGVPDECDIDPSDPDGNGLVSDDCNSNGIPDECELLGNDCNDNAIPDDCEPDCQPNGVPDDCDITTGASQDCNANGVPDQCDIASATSPDWNGNGRPDECDPPLPAPPPHDVFKNRYVSFVPDNASLEVAFAVELVSGPGVTGNLGWVSTPDVLPPCGYVARVVSTPVYRVWTEDVIQLGDCEIFPGSAYGIRTVVPSVPPFQMAEALTVATSLYGDCVGDFDGEQWTAPNGVVNFQDINAAVQGFQETATAPHPTRVDIDPQVPNCVINFSDISLIIKAFQGDPYPPPSWSAPTPMDCP